MRRGSRGGLGRRRGDVLMHGGPLEVALLSLDEVRVCDGVGSAARAAREGAGCWRQQRVGRAQVVDGGQQRRGRRGDGGVVGEQQAVGSAAVLARGGQRRWRAATNRAVRGVGEVGRRALPGLSGHV